MPVQVGRRGVVVVVVADADADADADAVSCCGLFFLPLDDDIPFLFTTLLFTLLFCVSSSSLPLFPLGSSYSSLMILLPHRCGHELSLLLFLL